MKKTVASCIISFLKHVFTSVSTGGQRPALIAIFNILANMLKKNTNLYSLDSKLKIIAFEIPRVIFLCRHCNLKTSTKDEPVQHLFQVRDPEQNECKMKILLSINFNFVLGTQKNRLNDTVLLSTHNI